MVLLAVGVVLQKNMLSKMGGTSDTCSTLILQFDVPPLGLGHFRSPSIVQKGCLL